MITPSRSDQEQVAHLLILERARKQRHVSSKPIRKQINLAVAKILKAERVGRESALPLFEGVPV